MIKIKNLLLIFIVFVAPNKLFSMEEAAATAEPPAITAESLAKLKVQASLDFLFQAVKIFENCECEKKEDGKDGFFANLHKELVEKYKPMRPETQTLESGDYPRFQQKLDIIINFVKSVELALFKFDLLCNFAVYDYKIYRENYPKRSMMFPLNKSAFSALQIYFFDPKTTPETIVAKKIRDIRFDAKIVTTLVSKILSNFENFKHLSDKQEITIKDYLNGEKDATYDPLFVHDYLYLLVEKKHQEAENAPKKQQDLLANINHAIYFPEKKQANKADLVAALKYGINHYMWLAKEKIAIEKTGQKEIETTQQQIAANLETWQKTLTATLEPLEAGLEDDTELAKKLPLFKILKDQMEVEKASAGEKPEQRLNITKKYATHFDLLAKAGEALRLQTDKLATTINSLRAVGLAQFAISIHRDFTTKNDDNIELINQSKSKTRPNLDAELALAKKHFTDMETQLEEYSSLIDDMSKYNIATQLLNRALDNLQKLDPEEDEYRKNAQFTLQVWQAKLLQHMNKENLKIQDEQERIKLFAESNKLNLINIILFLNDKTLLKFELEQAGKPWYEQLSENWYLKVPANTLKIELRKDIQQKQEYLYKQLSEEWYQKLPNLLKEMIPAAQYKQLSTTWYNQLPENWYTRFPGEWNGYLKEQWYEKVQDIKLSPEAYATLSKGWYEKLSYEWKKQISQIANSPLEKNRNLPNNLWIVSQYKLEPMPKILQPISTDLAKINTPLNMQLSDGLSELANWLQKAGLDLQDKMVRGWITDLRDNKNAFNFNLFNPKDAANFAQIYNDFIKENGPNIENIQQVISETIAKVPEWRKEIEALIAAPLLANIKNELVTLNSELNKTTIIPQIAQIEQKISALKKLKANIIEPSQELIESLKSFEPKTESLVALIVRLNQISSSTHQILKNPEKYDYLYEKYRFAEYLAKTKLGQHVPEFQSNPDLMLSALPQPSAPPTQFALGMSFIAFDTPPEQPVELQANAKLKIQIRNLIPRAFDLKMYDDIIMLQNISYESDITKPEAFNMFYEGKQGQIQALVQKINSAAIKKMHQKNIERGNAMLLENAAGELYKLPEAMDLGADINIQDGETGKTALIIAAEAGSAANVKYLLDQQANPLLFDFDEEDALTKAIKSYGKNPMEYTNVIAFLIKHQKMTIELLEAHAREADQEAQNVGPAPAKLIRAELEKRLPPTQARKMENITASSLEQSFVNIEPELAPTPTPTSEEEEGSW